VAHDSDNIVAVGPEVEALCRAVNALVACRRGVALDDTLRRPAHTGGYLVYYKQAGKLPPRGSVRLAVLTDEDTGGTSRQTYTCVVTAWKDCNGNGTFETSVDTESAVSSTASATAGSAIRSGDAGARAAVPSASTSSRKPIGSRAGLRRTAGAVPRSLARRGVREGGRARLASCCRMVKIDEKGPTVYDPGDG
jgi:hypothetical protein